MKIRLTPPGNFSPWIILTLIQFISLTNFICASKILILHPLYSGSHVLTLRNVADSLAERGHRLHIVRWKDAHVFPAQNNPNITSTTLAMDNSNGRYNFLTKEKRAAFQVPFDILWNYGAGAVKPVLQSREAFPLLREQCEVLLGNEKLRKYLTNENFDLAIIDILYNECGLALLNSLKLPVVGYWAFPFASGEADYTTAFLPPSHVPSFLSKLGHEMTFWERLYNILLKAGSHLMMWIHCSNVDSVVQKYLPGTPHPFDLLKDLNGMLINTDYALDYPRLLPPTFINVGGMQIAKTRELPKDIKDWIDSSGDDGVVLFTMGFIFNPNVVPKEFVNTFMKAFSRLPQKFLVKFSGHIDHIPLNVKVLEWIPQQDVLAHPKTRAFLTHCGLHGVMEGIYFGVPMVGMPIFIDQGDILVRMKERGIALGFNKDNTTEDEIYETLREVIVNPKYKANAKKLSFLMRDVRESPFERAIYMLEYLIRHKGAEHLKLSSRHLNFFQYFSLDTLSFIFIIFTAICYVSKTIFFKYSKKAIARIRPYIISTLRNFGSTGYRQYCSVQDQLIPHPNCTDQNASYMQMKQNKVSITNNTHLLPTKKYGEDDAKKIS